MRMAACTSDKAVSYIKKAVDLQFLKTNLPAAGNCKILGVSQKAFDDMPQERVLRDYTQRNRIVTLPHLALSVLSLCLCLIHWRFSLAAVVCTAIGSIDISSPTVLPTRFFTTGSHLVQHPAW